MWIRRALDLLPQEAPPCGGASRGADLARSARLIHDEGPARLEPVKPGRDAANHFSSDFCPTLHRKSKKCYLQPAEFPCYRRREADGDNEQSQT